MGSTHLYGRIHQCHYLCMCNHGRRLFVNVTIGHGIKKENKWNNKEKANKTKVTIKIFLIKTYLCIKTTMAGCFQNGGESWDFCVSYEGQSKLHEAKN